MLIYYKFPIQFWLVAINSLVCLQSGTNVWITAVKRARLNTRRRQQIIYLNKIEQNKQKTKEKMFTLTKRPIQSQSMTSIPKTNENLLSFNSQRSHSDGKNESESQNINNYLIENNWGKCAAGKSVERSSDTDIEIDVRVHLRGLKLPWWGDTSIFDHQWNNLCFVNE